MINPYEIIDRRLSAIERVLQELRQQRSVMQAAIEVDPYGDFAWLCSTCSGIPPSTLRIKSAAGEIPGVVKFGKRRLYEKAAVLNWLRSLTLTRTATDATLLEQDAEAQISRQLQKRGGEQV